MSPNELERFHYLSSRLSNAWTRQDALLGEIIATLTIHRNRELIAKALPDALPIISRWVERYQEIGGGS